MKKYKLKQLKRFRVYFIFDAYKRTKYLVDHKVFKDVGDNFFFQPRKIPADPELVKFKNNVVVASDVTFITHDITNLMLNNLNHDYFKYYSDCIEVGNNVFIGSNTIILPNIKIGDNVIIGAGSVVTKDIPNNSVVTGNPAKVIESFDEYFEKRSKSNKELIEYTKDVKSDELWKRFYEVKGE